MSQVIYIQDSDFDQLLDSDELVVVDFTASWCGPCRKIAPLLDQLADAYEGRVKVVKIDIDQNKATAKQYAIRSIPAVLLFKGGELAETLVGVAPYETFTEAVEKLL